MFLEFYKLREQPFGVTPDPRFLYFGATHREALASLLYSVEAKRGFSALVAEPGMGKTSLLFRMLDSLRNSTRTAFLFQTEGDSREILSGVLRDLGIEAPVTDPGAMRQALNEGLMREVQSGKQVVVVIDEAQNLDPRVLETVRLLSNFETSRQKLMHIVLAGQPGLAAKLADKSMTQLRQRISTLIRLEPFRDDDVVKYIQHRLHAAGHEGASIFTPEALQMISRISQGIPRNINSICFQAMSIGFAMQAKRIGAEIVSEVISDLDFNAQWEDRRRGLEPAPWRPPALESASFAESARLGAWDTLQAPRRRGARGKWVAAIAFLVVIPASLIALSDNNLGLSQTRPGRFSERVVNAVLNSKDPNADFIPAWPNKLKPPEPPPAAEVPAAAATTPAADSPATPAAAEPASADLAEVTHPADPVASPSNTTKKVASAATPATAKTPSDDRSEATRIRNGLYGVPTGVQVLRSETVFQFAQEMYGQSNWTIIEAICAANPGIHDPYAVLRTGQWVRLPKDLETVTANYNSRGTMGRPH
jgi:general secretion pathway protein A